MIAGGCDAPFSSTMRVESVTGADFGSFDAPFRPPVLVLALSIATSFVVPMRVVANGEGAEVLLTIFRQPGMSDEKFGEDTQWVRRDLEALKAILEG